MGSSETVCVLCIIMCIDKGKRRRKEGQGTGGPPSQLPESALDCLRDQAGLGPNVIGSNRRGATKADMSSQGFARSKHFGVVTHVELGRIMGSGLGQHPGGTRGKATEVENLTAFEHIERIRGTATTTTTTCPTPFQ